MIRHLDDGVAELQDVISWMQKSQTEQLGGMADLDLGATATMGPNFRMPELLKARGIYYEDFFNEGRDETHFPKALAYKADAKL